jgi:hypothetical protein
MVLSVLTIFFYADWAYRRYLWYRERVPIPKGSEGTYGTLPIQGASIKYIDTWLRFEPPHCSTVDIAAPRGGTLSLYLRLLLVVVPSRKSKGLDRCHRYLP